MIRGDWEKDDQGRLGGKMIDGNWKELYVCQAAIFNVHQRITKANSAIVLRV